MMDQEKIDRAISELKKYRNYYSNEVIGTLYIALETVAKIPEVIDELENKANEANTKMMYDEDNYYCGKEDGIDFAIKTIQEKLCGGEE